MPLFRVFFAGLLGTALTAPAFAQSTIDPSLPANGTPYSSTPIRNNFQAATMILMLYTLEVKQTLPFPATPHSSQQSVKSGL